VNLTGITPKYADPIVHVVDRDEKNIRLAKLLDVFAPRRKSKQQQSGNSEYVQSFHWFFTPLR